MSESQQGESPSVRYTPGPWSIGVWTGKYQVIPANDRERIGIERIHPLHFGAMSIGSTEAQVAIIPLDESNEANARLIAAAPEMLEAINIAIAALEHSLNWVAENSELWKDGHAAITIIRATAAEATAA
jgi:hypothetical protein